MNSKKLVAWSWFERGDGWRSGGGTEGGFSSGTDLNGDFWGGTWQLGRMRGSPQHCLSEVRVEEMRVINHFPAVKTKGLQSSQARGSGANKIGGKEGVTVPHCFSLTTSSGLQKPDKWLKIQELEESQACKGFWEALITFLGRFIQPEACAVGVGGGSW